MLSTVCQGYQCRPYFPNMVVGGGCDDGSGGVGLCIKVIGWGQQNKDKK